MGKIKVENGVLIFCVVSILAQASLILSASGKLPPQIPIFYSKPWGEPMLGPPIALWILPALVFNLFVRSDHAGHQMTYLSAFILLISSSFSETGHK